MIFNIPDNIQTLDRNDCQYLYANTTMFGELKLGDLMMYSTLLRLMKVELINKFPNRFNNDNLFFILNRLGGLNVKDIRPFLSLFPDIWKDCLTDLTTNYNVSQIVNGGNIWSFKCYLEKNNISLTDYNNVHVLNPSNLCLTDNKRNNVYIMPVRGKNYNVERNMTEDQIIKIINNITVPRERIIIITKDIDLNFRYIKSRTNKKDLTEFGNKMTWLDIILTMLSNCKLYISGDCGFSHLVSIIKSTYKPEMIIYYNTNQHHIKKPHNKFDRVVRTVNFKPYRAYKSDIMQIKKVI